MDKARKIHLDVIRVKRNEHLAALDIPFIVALEKGDQALIADISKTKQMLRDIPQTLDLVTNVKTPEDLQNIWPSNLTQE